MKRRENDSKPNWDKSNHSIFEDFALELQDYTRTEELPVYGDRNVRYVLELQQKRLKSKDLKMEYEFVPNGHFANGGGIGKSWSDERYINHMEYRTCRFTKNFYRESSRKRVYRKKQNSIFYQIMTFVHDAALVGEELYTCPNCGAISKVKELQKGCAYCGTFFEMNDLFPKVSNFFFIKSFGGTGKEVKRSIKRVMLPCIVPAIIALAIYYYLNDPNLAGNFLLSALVAVIPGVFLGGIIGYMAWAIWTLASLFKEAAKSASMLINTAGSAGKFVELMKQYSPEFSFEYFAAKVVSLLKMIIYAENMQELPYYVGPSVDGMFSDIVESSYSGAVALKQFQVKQDKVFVTVDVYMQDIYDKEGRIKQKNEKFRLVLCKNISKPVDFNFSIKEIQCKSCGRSFDATKLQCCPGCDMKYEIGDDDWVVVKIEKR